MDNNNTNYQVPSNTQANTARKLLVPFVILVLVSLISGSVYYFIAIHGKAKVELLVAPSTATIYLNDEEFSVGSHRLDPGEYRVYVTREGFEAYEDTFIVGEDDELNVLPVALIPETADARAEADLATEEYKKVEAASGILSQREGEQFQANNPIVNRLPHSTLFYRIDYRLSDESADEIVLQITAESDLDRDFALSQIRDWGFNPDDFTIEYKN